MSDIKFSVLTGQTKRLSDNSDGTYSDTIAIIGGAASGLAPVIGTFNATGTSIAFSPHAMRSFNISLWGTFVANIVLERSFDGGTTWLPVRMLPAYSFNAPMSDTFQDGEYGNQYRFNCASYISGTVNYRISQ
jgi:hypothetical protein